MTLYYSIGYYPFMLRILCVERSYSSPIIKLMGLFYCPKFGRDADMCDLSNAEVFNRWKHSKKQTARDYWFDFLKSRANRGVEGAQDFVDKIELCSK